MCKTYLSFKDQYAEYLDAANNDKYYVSKSDIGNDKIVLTLPELSNHGSNDW